MVVRGVEGTLIIVVGVVQSDLRPGSNADIVVVVGVSNRGSRGWSTMPVALSTLSPSKAAPLSAETARRKTGAEEPHQRLGRETGLQRQPEIVARRLFVHGRRTDVAAALGDALGGP